jgi:hypothetical protein
MEASMYRNFDELNQLRGNFCDGRMAHAACLPVTYAPQRARFPAPNPVWEKDKTQKGVPTTLKNYVEGQCASRGCFSAWGPDHQQAKEALDQMFNVATRYT